MSTKLLGVILLVCFGVIGALVVDRLDRENAYLQVKADLEAAHKAHAIALVRAQDRYIEREQLAQEALDEYRKEVAVPRPVPGGERLRDAIRAAGDRDREVASAECRGVEDRAATYRQLLDEADQLLGEGESLAAEFSAAAEQHASEVRLLKRRAEADREVSDER